MTPYTGSGSRHATISIMSDDDFIITDSVATPLEELADNDAANAVAITNNASAISAANAAIATKASLTGATFTGVVSAPQLKLGTVPTYLPVHTASWGPAGLFNYTADSEEWEDMTDVTHEISTSFTLRAGDIVVATFGGVYLYTDAAGSPYGILRASVGANSASLRNLAAGNRVLVSLTLQTTVTAGLTCELAAAARSNDPEEATYVNSAYSTDSSTNAVWHYTVYRASTA